MIPMLFVIDDFLFRICLDMDFFNGKSGKHFGIVFKICAIGVKPARTNLLSNSPAPANIYYMFFRFPLLRVRYILSKY